VRSGWQLAHQAWQESGIDWELPAETGELFQAWQGSVRRAAAPRRWLTVAASWRNRAWRAARIGVPAAVVVAVGAAALVMLTGGANEMLAVRAGGAAGVRTAIGGARVPSGARSPVTLHGYPGQQGIVSVASMWSAGVTVAVGSADGHPAVWRHVTGPAAGWTLESGALLGAGSGSLAAVTDGPAGWIAVGMVVAGGATEPVVLISRDGISWQPAIGLATLAGPGARFLGVAAGRGGYVIVGRQQTDGRTFAALWWSADLRTLTAASNGGLDGRLAASTANAVTTTGDGFVAVGAHGKSPAVWTSRDGRNWDLTDLPVPAGARDATLGLVTPGRARGSRVVAAGYAVSRMGDMPVIVASADGGNSWHEIVLGTAGTVTALTAAGNGFLAAGLSGAAGPLRAIVWTSPDGLTWSAASPAGSGAGEITALDPAGPSANGTTGTGSTGNGSGVTGIAQRAAGSAVVTLQAR